jgi:hypothetical protein
MAFYKYQHIERIGTDEVDGIEFGKCLIFYKLDGTNSSVWMEDGEVHAGSRNRELSLENDNAGFFAHVKSNKNILDYLNAHPTHRVFGEWLVPHSLKTYREDAWRTFYVFDIIQHGEGEHVEYIPYDIYKPMLEEFGVNYIPPLAVITNPSYEQLIKCLEKTGQFLVKDGAGNGEGIVIKNYDFYNKYHRQTWAKIVSNEFKEKHHKEMGAPESSGEVKIEERILEDFCTNDFIEKEYAKLVLELGGWKSEYIPRLLSTCFTTLIKEESYNMIKKYKLPKIDYKTLNALVIRKIKEIKKEIFC